MKAELSRLRHKPEERYSGVIQQQGRMITDADWNELQQIVKRRQEMVAEKTVGSGVPKEGGLLRFTGNIDGDADLDIDFGAVIVDGIYAEVIDSGDSSISEKPDLEEKIRHVYGNQRDFPNAPPLPKGSDRPARSFIYVDVWERLVVSVQDNALIDPALHGADTCARMQTLAQVKFLNVKALDPIQFTAPRCGDAIFELKDIENPIDVQTSCVEKQAISTSLGNLLFRLEVHDNVDSKITLKWSYENGAEAHEVLTAPSDFKTGNWIYEFFSETTERQLGFHNAPSEAVKASLVTTGFPSSPGEDSALESLSLVRRWDGYCVIEKTSTGWALTDGMHHGDKLHPSDVNGVLDDGTLNLEFDALKLTLKCRNKTFLPGDYWLALIRSSSNDESRLKILSSKPVGIVHHYLPLLTCQWANGERFPFALGYPFTDSAALRRLSFPALTDISADRVAYDSSVSTERWRDINEQADQHPVTVQQAIDRFFTNFDSEDISYTVPSCNDDDAPTIRSLINMSAGESVKVSDIIDKLLCILNATHLPLDKTDAGDLSALLGNVDTVKTVQQALTFLANYLADLDATKVSHVIPDCGSETAHTVCSLMNLPTGEETAVTISFTLEKLLCLLNASHVPLDFSQTDGLPSTIANSRTVQDALLSLSSSIRGKGVYITVGYGGHYSTLPEAVDALDSVPSPSLFLLPGVHRLNKELYIEKKRSIQLHGAGPGGTVLEFNEPVQITADRMDLRNICFKGTGERGGVRVLGEEVIVKQCEFVRQVNHCFFKRFGSNGSALYCQSITADSKGNALIVGYFSGTLNLGGDVLTSDNTDAFVLKLDPDGNHIWSTQIGGALSDFSHAVSVDREDNVLVSGHFSGTISFCGEMLTSSGSSDILLLKFSQTGNLLWSRSFGGTSGDYAYDMAIDSNGSIILTGYFFRTLNFGGEDIVGSSGGNIFVLKLTPDGNHLWSKGFGDVYVDSRCTLALDSDDSIFLSGQFSNTINLGGQDLSGIGEVDVFIAKLTKDGDHVWSRSLVGTGTEYGTALAADAMDNIVMAGHFSGSLVLGDEQYVSAGPFDLFVIKLTPNGELIWGKQFGGSASDYGTDLAVDGFNNIIVTGYFGDVVNFGGKDLLSAGDIDVFVLKLSPSGDYIWSEALGGPSTDRGYGIALYKEDCILLAGQFREQISVGGDTLYAEGDVDMFVVTLRATSDLPMAAIHVLHDSRSGQVSPSTELAFADNRFRTDKSGPKFSLAMLAVETEEAGGSIRNSTFEGDIRLMNAMSKNMPRLNSVVDLSHHVTPRYSLMLERNRLHRIRASVNEEDIDVQGRIVNPPRGYADLKIINNIFSGEQSQLIGRNVTLSNNTFQAATDARIDIVTDNLTAIANISEANILIVHASKRESEAANIGVDFKKVDEM